MGWQNTYIGLPVYKRTGREILRVYDGVIHIGEDFKLWSHSGVFKRFDKTIFGTLPYTTFSGKTNYILKTSTPFLKYPIVKPIFYR
jgi:hypothetical protein